jgi:virginiamycin B lyase
MGIATGSDRNLYFAERMGNRIGLLPLGGGAITEYSVPTSNAFPNKHTLGADGLIYFAEQAASKIGRLQ